MYFAIGIPKSLVLTHKNSKLESDTEENADKLVSEDFQKYFMARSHCGKYFMTGQANSIHLWNLMPSILLCNFKRSEESLEILGGNLEAYWSLDSKFLAIKTSNGYLQLFEIEKFSHDEKVFQYQFPAEDIHYTPGAGQSKGLDGYSIKLISTVFVEEKIQHCVPLENCILVLTVENNRFFSLSWQGALLQELVDFQQLQLLLEKQKTSIMKFNYLPKLGLYTFLLENQSVYLLFKNDNNGLENADIDERKSIHFFCKQKEGETPCVITEISMNSNYKLLALGTEKGDVFVYHLKDNDQIVLSHLLKKPFKAESPVTSLQWTCDGNALAVSWSQFGFSVWTCFGRLLNHTYIETPKSTLLESDFFLKGISSLFWSLGGYELFILPRYQQNGNNLKLYSVTFAKQAISTCNYAVSNTNGNKIAVAGKTGFCIYNQDTRRWKLFGNHVHEKSFTCDGGMVWYEDFLLVSCKDLIKQTTQLKAFQTNLNLDINMLAFDIKFEKKILLINLFYRHLLVYTEDYQLYYYFLTQNSKESLQYQLVQTFQLNQLMLNSEHGLQYFDWFLPDACSLELEQPIRNNFHFVILKEGKLKIAQYEENDNWSQMELMTQTEFCFLFYLRRPLGTLYNSLLAFSGNETKIWINLLLKPNEQFQWTTDHSEGPLKIQFDFYPMSLLLQKGIIVGMDQHLSLNRLGEGVYFRYHAKATLIIHHLIKSLLVKNLEKEAVDLAGHFQNLDYFGHSMEILLHSLLEKEAESLLGFHREALLPRFVSFLRHYPRYFYQVVVQCARKTEYTLWEYLFSIIGDPKKLFRECLELGQFKVASSLLIILQTLEPQHISGRLQIELLEKTLEQEDFDLCGEIVRYLTFVTASHANKDTQPYIDLEQRKSPRVGLLAISSDEEQTFYIDILISRHARKLMNEKRIRTVGKLAKSLNFPLLEWLRKERNRSAYLKDLKQIFKDLHVQFEWPYPSAQTLVSQQPVASKIDVGPLSAPLPSTGHQPFSFKEMKKQFESNKIPESDNGQLKESSRRSSMDETSLYSKHSSQNELFSLSDASSIGFRKRAPSFAPGSVPRRQSFRNDLEDEIRQAKCFGWSILLATLLFDLNTVIEILLESKAESDSANLIEAYRDALQSTGNVEYSKFLSSVEQVFTLT